MLPNNLITKGAISVYIKLLLICAFLLPSVSSAQQKSLSAVQIKNAGMVKETIATEIRGTEIDARIYQTLLQQSKNQYLWFDTTGLTLTGLTLNSVLADLGWHDVVNSNALSLDEYTQHDKLLSKGFLQLIRINQRKNSLTVANAESVLLTALNEHSADELLFAVLPEYDQISQLRKAIAYYRHLSAYPWPALDLTFKPKLGQSHFQVKGIRQILTLLGDLPVRAQSKNRLDVFDSVVVDALKKFQARHGLVSDGKLGPNTYAALQIPPQQRIKQMQVNLRRWFTLPNQPPEKYLLVNIPDYQLSVIENGLQTLQMKVIVGDIENQTPQLITQIDRITFNPTWTPTVNIINNELLREHEQDYLALKRKNFRLVKGYAQSKQIKEIDQAGLNLSELLQSYRLVQQAGENNALGIYRFNIPNTQAIYLHDTPVKSLFNKQGRALSHGCVRLENPDLLAKYLLSVEEAHKEKIMYDALASGKTTNLSLRKNLPVYITYQTTWFDKQGALRFLPDIYELDQAKENHSL